MTIKWIKWKLMRSIHQRLTKQICNCCITLSNIFRIPKNKCTISLPISRHWVVLSAMISAGLSYILDILGMFEPKTSRFSSIYPIQLSFRLDGRNEWRLEILQYCTYVNHSLRPRGFSSITSDYFFWHFVKQVLLQLLFYCFVFLTRKNRFLFIPQHQILIC